MKAMLLTAGLGTRLRPVTERFAKPAVPFLNVPLLYYSLLLLEEAGIHSLVLNTHHLPDQIAALARDIPGAKFDVKISSEAPAPLGSGGGIWKAREFLDGGGDFLVANGDEVILPRESGIMNRFVEAHKESGALATILVMKHPLVGTQFGGVWADGSGRVHGFGKDGSKFGSSHGALTGYHYIGLLLLNDRVFRYLPEGESNILYDALTAAMAQGEKVRVMVGSFTWFETGNPHDFISATREAMVLAAQGSGESAKTLLKTLDRFSKYKLEKGILLGEGAIVEKGAEINGFAVLGKGAVIERGASVTDCVLLPGARVRAEETVREQILLSV